MYSYLSIADLFSDGEITALSFGEGFKKRKKGFKIREYEKCLEQGK